MLDHTRTVIFDQVTIMLHLISSDEIIFDQVTIILHLISSDEIYDQAILEDLSSTGNFQTCIETDIIKDQDIMIHALCTRLDHDG